MLLMRVGLPDTARDFPPLVSRHCQQPLWPCSHHVQSCLCACYKPQVSAVIPLFGHTNISTSSVTGQPSKMECGCAGGRGSENGCVYNLSPQNGCTVSIKEECNRRNYKRKDNPLPTPTLPQSVFLSVVVGFCLLCLYYYYYLGGGGGGGGGAISPTWTHHHNLSYI